MSKLNTHSFSDLENGALKEYFDGPRIKAQEQRKIKERAECNAMDIIQRLAGDSNVNTETNPPR